MKIVFLISSMKNGGAERVMSILANYFINYEEVTLCTMSNEDFFYTLDKRIKIKKLNLIKDSVGLYSQIKNNFFRIKTFYQVFQEEEPDIIISFMTQINILSIIAAKLLKKKIIISERTNYDYSHSFLWKFLRRIVYPLSDTLVVVSKYDYQKYYFIPENRKVIIYNPITIIKDDDEVNFGKKEKIILAVGRLIKAKGFDLLIKAYFLSGVNWPLYIIGEGQERENLEKLICEYGLENRVFLEGQKKNVKQYYDKASIFILSSRREGFPNVLIEAMSLGCASIAFNCRSGPNEIISNGENGLLIPSENIKKLAKALKKLIKDDELRMQLAQNAIKVREEFSLKSTMNQWKVLINKIIEEKENI